MLLLVGGVYLNLNSAGAWAQEFCGINFKPCPGSQDIRILSLRLFTNKKSHSSCPIFWSQVQSRWFPPDSKAVKVALDVNQLNPRSSTVRPWKTMVGRQLSFWKGNFSGAFAVKLQECKICIQMKRSGNFSLRISSGNMVINWRRCIWTGATRQLWIHWSYTGQVCVLIVFVWHGNTWRNVSIPASLMLGSNSSGHFAMFS